MKRNSKWAGISIGISPAYLHRSRLAIQYHVRRIKKDIRDSDFKTIEKLRTTLLTLLNKLIRLQATAGVGNILAPEAAVNLQRPIGGVTTRSQTAAQLVAVADAPPRYSAPPANGEGNIGPVTGELALIAPVNAAARNGGSANAAPMIVDQVAITPPTIEPANAALVSHGPASGGPVIVGPVTIASATAGPAHAAPAANTLVNNAPANVPAGNVLPGKPVPPPGLHGAPAVLRQEDLIYWDSLVDMANAVNPANSASDPAADIPPEKMKLPLPSNMSVPQLHCTLELLFRKQKAKAILNQIRELIAEKSFTYTDEIRKAPRKGVRTRGQTAVIELNRRLSLLCQIYAWNRAQMVDLQADEDTLAAYQVLQKDDVKCSTAVLQPNKAGSTKLKLSWIWHSVDRRIMAGLATPETSDPATLAECRSAARWSSSPADIAQSAEYTGFVPVHRLNGGAKKPFWSATKWNGQWPTTDTKVRNGPPLRPSFQTSPPAQQPMHGGNRQRGPALPILQKLYLHVIIAKIMFNLLIVVLSKQM